MSSEKNNPKTTNKLANNQIGVSLYFTWGLVVCWISIISFMKLTLVKIRGAFSRSIWFPRIKSSSWNFLWNLHSTIYSKILPEIGVFSSFQQNCYRCSEMLQNFWQGLPFINTCKFFWKLKKTQKFLYKMAAQKICVCRLCSFLKHNWQQALWSWESYIYIYRQINIHFFIRNCFWTGCKLTAISTWQKL